MSSQHSTSGYSWAQLNEALNISEGAAYLLKLETFRRNVGQLLGTLSSHYANVSLGYSYKTNYLPSLCCEAEHLGLYAEVVSGVEYELARQLGVGGERIIFNGPAKSKSEIALAIKEGALVNVDSLSEVQLVVELAAHFNRPARVGLRCNLGFAWQKAPSRFGLRDSTGELEEAFNKLQQAENITVEGLHCHTSYSRTAESYHARINRLIELSDKLFSGEPPKFLNVGGGICGPMSKELVAQLPSPPPTYEDYAQAICKPMLERYGPNGPKLFLEPGVGLVADVFDFVYRVEHVKNYHEKSVVVTSGSVNFLKIVKNDINLPTDLYPSPSYRVGEDTENRKVTSNISDLVGFTCLEHDIIYRGFAEPVSQGDILITRNAGAYSMVIAPDFIRSAPAVLELAPSGHWNVLKERASTASLLERFNW